MEPKFNLTQYTEACARQLKLISHSDTNVRYFTANNLGDLDGLIGDLYNKQPPYLVAIDSHAENNLNEDCSQQFFTVLVLDRVSTVAKGIARSFKSKLLNDREHAANGLAGLDIETISETSFGPLGELNGRMITFYIADGNGLKYVQEEWNE